MNVLRAVLITLSLSLLLGCSSNLTVRADYDVVLLEECPLHNYSETELAQCYIELTLEVRKGNLQLEKFKGQ